MTTQGSRQLESRGVAGVKISDDLPKQRYFTPSGEEVFAFTSNVGFDIRDTVTGKIIRQGKRDRNLDKGWTLTMPTELKIHCTGCRKYHDTQEEVVECLRLRAINAAKWEARASTDASAPPTDTEGRLDKLEEGLSDIKDDIKTLLQLQLGAKNG